MALIVQNDSGTVVDANAYITVVEFKAYHDARGNSYGAVDDPTLEKKIILATDYLDERFTFVGEPQHARAQTTAWPRIGAVDRFRNLVVGVPREVKEATAEYALRALTADLNPDPVRDETGATIASKSETVGEVSESVSYVEGSAVTAAMPKYPAADQKLRRAGLVVSGGVMVRG